MEIYYIVQVEYQGVTENMLICAINGSEARKFARDKFRKERSISTQSYVEAKILHESRKAEEIFNYMVIHNNSNEPVDVFIVDGNTSVPAVCIDGNGDELVFERVREAFEHANRNHGEAGITEIHFTLADGTELEFVEVKGNEWGYQGWDLKPLKGILIKKDPDEIQTNNQMG